uniref:hypothetical protein n=1 Tax=Alloprevotella sp. TaxID=1872471 RepID=UPI003FEFF0F5
MKKYFMSVAALAGMMSLAACSSDDIVSPADNDVQTIKIAVASTGDKSTRSRDLNSEEPGQNIESVAVVIRNKKTNEVVYHKVITDWKEASSIYTDNGHGREYTLKLEKGQRLNAGEYTITAVGYTAADFKNNTIESATTGVAAGNFTAEVADDKAAQEAFAGESSIKLLENHEGINPSVTLHRQVAGYYGYFTSIPVEVNSKKVTNVRLVARSKNTKLTYGNFNSSFTTTNKDIMYVVNGSEPATTKDAKFNGSAENDAYTLYNIKVADWFTHGDMNNDGILDEKDALIKDGWTNALADKGYKTYQQGTIFAGGFAVPFAAADAATLELQLLDANGEILKSWTVAMATAQPTGQGVDGVALTVPETAQNFSFFRNHMYTLGKKMDNTDKPGTTTPDEPEPLDKSQSMILRVNDNWEVINRMTIGD